MIPQSCAVVSCGNADLYGGRYASGDLPGATIPGTSFSQQGSACVESVTVYTYATAAGQAHGDGLTPTTDEMTLKMQRFEEAITSYQQALAIRRETGDRHGEGQALNNLGHTYKAMRRPGRASACWLEAAAAMRAAGDHEEAGRRSPGRWPSTRPGRRSPRPTSTTTCRARRSAARSRTDSFASCFG